MVYHTLKYVLLKKNNNNSIIYQSLHYANIKHLQNHK